MIIILSVTLEKKTSEHHTPIIPVDAEAVSVTSQTIERVRCTLDKCHDQNFLTDALTDTLTNTFRPFVIQAKFE